MNKTVEVRGILIGEGLPKICASIIGKTEEEILTNAKYMLAEAVDIVEWRIDYYINHSKTKEVLQLLEQLRKVLGEKPIILTFRTASEGGEAEITLQQYASLYESIIDSNCIDIIDLEMNMEKDILHKLIMKARGNGIKVIISNHDFEKTPLKEELEQRLIAMQSLGADIAKLAVMPQSKGDVYNLLEATNHVTDSMDIPVVTMSMAKLGVITRVLCGYSGSAITFGTIGKASAPGQLPVLELKELLSSIHSIINE